LQQSEHIWYAPVFGHRYVIGPISHSYLESDAVRKKINLTNDFKQASERYHSLSKVDQNNLVDNIIDSLGKANKQIRQPMVANLTKADPEFGKRVAAGLKL
jgi:catalase